MRDNIEVRMQVIDTSPIPFEKAPQSPVRWYSKIFEDEEKCLHYSMALSRALSKLAYKIERITFDSSALLWSSLIISCLGAIGYLGFNAYLLYVYIGHSKIGLYVALLACNSAYALFYTWGNINSILTKDFTGIQLVPYSFSCLSYVGLSIASIVVLFHDEYDTYGIISCILFLASLYGPTIYFLIVFATMIPFLIICLLELLFVYVFEFIIRDATCALFKCRKNKDDTNGIILPIYCSVYYYDKFKTTAIQCTICLCEFENRKKICVGNCHITHLFHVECLIEWLKYKIDCPICKSTSGYRK